MGAQKEILRGPDSELQFSAFAGSQTPAGRKYEKGFYRK